MDAIAQAINAFDHKMVEVAWGWLALALSIHVLRIVVNTKAWQNTLKAAYPFNQEIRFWKVFRSLTAGVAANIIAPFRGGDVVRVVMAAKLIPGSSKITIVSTIVVENIFNIFVTIVFIAWSIVYGLLPGIDAIGPVASSWSWFSTNLLPAIGLGILLLTTILMIWRLIASYVVRLYSQLVQGFTILTQPYNYLSKVVGWQIADWLCRFGTSWCYLNAFGLPASLHYVVIVQLATCIVSVFPVTPSGAGTFQGTLIYLFYGQLSQASALSLSIGMMCAATIVNLVIGIGSLLSVFKTLKIRQAIQHESTIVIAELIPLEGEV